MTWPRNDPDPEPLDLDLAELAIRKLVWLMNEARSEAVQLAAARELLNRSRGHPR
jgi:hypothetical protein